MRKEKNIYTSLKANKKDLDFDHHDRYQNVKCMATTKKVCFKSGDETILLPGKKLSFLIWPTADHWLNLSPCSRDLWLGGN